MFRTILSALLLNVSFASATACGAEAASDQAKAIAEIEKIGGKVAFDESSPAKPVIRIDLSQTKANDATLACLRHVPSIRVLILDGTNITDAGLDYLVGLKQITELSLGDRHIKDFSTA